ncbi:unnamed protein product [Phytophthora lilii]|uniref:Unnamed protein product n=1 Tax=Phytophthora lilii TaxID=2077276 RepID=A0A9W7CXK0_9STRA|nr:unnamed protein product [Phytophthora lilii]
MDAIKQVAMEASLTADEIAPSGHYSPMESSAQEKVIPTDVAEVVWSDGWSTPASPLPRRLQEGTLLLLNVEFLGTDVELMLSPCKYSFVVQLLTWVIAVYVVLVFAILAARNPGTATFAKVSESDNVFYLAVIAIAVYFVAKLALVVRFVVYWAMIAVLLVYAATGSLYALFWINDDTLSHTGRQVRYATGIALASIEVITVVAYWFTHYAYPWMVLHQKFNLVDWWNIKPGVETNTITYRSKARFYTRKRNVVKYCGGLNAQGQPHGYGMWTDTDYHGERLTGQWEDGVPRMD